MLQINPDIENHVVHVPSVDNTNNVMVLFFAQCEEREGEIATIVDAK